MNYCKKFLRSFVNMKFTFMNFFMVSIILARKRREIIRHEKGCQTSQGASRPSTVVSLFTVRNLPNTLGQTLAENYNFTMMLTPMFVERQVSSSALFTILVREHASAVSLPPVTSFWQCQLAPGMTSFFVHIGINQPITLQTLRYTTLNITVI